MPFSIPAWALKLLGCLAVCAVLIAAWEYTPAVGPRARVAQIAEDRDEWRRAQAAWEASSKGWKASFRKSETLRGEEARAAIDAVNRDQSSCDARVAEARRSSLAIERLLNAPPKIDDRCCPARSLLDPSELRDALFRSAAH